MGATHQDVQAWKDARRTLYGTRNQNDSKHRVRRTTNAPPTAIPLLTPYDKVHSAPMPEELRLDWQTLEQDSLRRINLICTTSSEEQRLALLAEEENISEALQTLAQRRAGN